jgi:hypothetical protein
MAISFLSETFLKSKKKKKKEHHDLWKLSAHMKPRGLVIAN